jgi:hypothetical protein
MQNIKAVKPVIKRDGGRVDEMSKDVARWDCWSTLFECSSVERAA